MDTVGFETLINSVRRLIRQDVVPREAEIEEKDEVPTDIREKALGLGLFGYTLPEEYGGLGLNTVEDVRLAIEFGYTTMAFRSMFATNVGLAGKVLVNAGTEDQKRTWLPRLAKGAIASFALSEPEAGSDPSGMGTRAVRSDDGGFVISGAKRFITNAPVADVFVVFARTGTGARPTDGISCFLVEAGTPGLSVGPRDGKTGQAGSLSSAVYFDEMKVPRSALVGDAEGVGFTTAMRSLANGRLNVAALSVGMTQRLLEESVAHAKSNRQGGHAIGEFQLVQAMLAETKTELDAGRELVLAAARRYQSGTNTKIGPSTAKLFCTEAAVRAADRAVQIHGGLGYMRATPVERLSRDARVLPIYEGTSEIQKLIIGRALLRADGQ
ncbi:acyl-CoA dehydrogenase family protein [Streptomyces sp. NPDC001978]|uniref:acyl-CoA dehydrogenase family protein n=1 Tax=Streptomyces sp. NPDC001978 TaxID=3364627 RepID=UPI003676159B